MKKVPSFILAPRERPSQFWERIFFSMRLGRGEAPRAQQALGIKQLKKLDSQTLALLERLFFLRPRGALLSEAGVPFWAGGASSFFSLGAKGPRGAIIHLGGGSFSRLFSYRKEEVLSHEMVHVARAAFPPSRFEELLAYQTSSSKLGAILGPLFDGSWEFLLFSLSILLGVFGDLHYLIFSNDLYPIPSLYLKALPFMYLGFASLRLWRRWRVLNLCRQRLEPHLERGKSTLAVLLRMADHEIAQLGKICPGAVPAWVEIRSKTCHRWAKICKLLQIRSV